MATTGAKAKKTAGKASRSPRSGSSPAICVFEVSSVFKHLGDPICLSILFALDEEACGIAQIGSALQQDPSAMTYQLALLRHVGLISPGRKGKQELYSLTDRGRRVVELARWLADDDQPRDEAPVTTSIDSALLKDMGGMVDDPVGWFLTRNPEFEWRRPIELLGTPDEQWLRDRILAAKLGMFS
jgi:DNA-binding transcriptional ArsR family regulator